MGDAAAGKVAAPSPGSRCQASTESIRQRSALTDADLNRLVEYQFGEGAKHALSVGRLMQHAVVHAVHHRGQITLMLHELGVEPGDFDILFYAEANAHEGV